MPIVRTDKQRGNYTRIDNKLLLDNRLSLKAKGLMCQILCRPDDWDFYASELGRHSNDGRHSLNSALQELLRLGYLKQASRPGIAGRFAGYCYTAYENPTEAGKQTRKKPINRSGKLDTSNTYNASKNESNAGSFPISNNGETEEPDKEKQYQNEHSRSDLRMAIKRKTVNLDELPEVPD